MNAVVENPAVLRIPTARAFVPLLDRCRYKGARGGRASAKSHFFGGNIVDEAVCYTDLRAACFRETQKSLRQSSKQLIEDKIRKFKVEHYFRIMRDEIQIKGPNGKGNGIILFQGLQDHTAESIKSLEGFNIGWTSEAQSLSDGSLRKLRPTFRYVEGMPWNPELWFDWNPTKPDDAVELLFEGGKPAHERNLPDNMRIVDVSYKDNPWLPDDIKAEIAFDFRRDPEMAAHVWLGAYEERSEARVFNNWIVEEFETPSDAEFLYGSDWGFSVDPTVLVRMFTQGRKLFIDRELYKVGLPIDHCPLFFGGMKNANLAVLNAEALLDLRKKGVEYKGIEGCEKWEITADSARPETIDYMKRHGFPRMVGSVKGPNSVQEGVEFIREFDIIIHPDCTHAVSEFTHYKYKTDKHTGVVLPVLSDKKNHYIDSIRYALEKRRRNRKSAGVW